MNRQYSKFGRQVIAKQTDTVRADFKEEVTMGSSEYVYIYCPRSDFELIKSCFVELPVIPVFNDYSVNKSKRRVICHYNLAELSESECDFLVHMMEIGQPVQPLVSFLDEYCGYTAIELLKPQYFLHQKTFSILSNNFQSFVKRLTDIIGALTIGLITLPIILVTALLIILTSKGPVIYSQRRVGQFNREFDVYKFRSMRVNAEENGAVWAKINDNRVTPIGRFIRKTRIDELPQLVNVLKGDMSLIGPRPERMVFVEKLEEHIPYYKFRHAVKPGLTGLAQVKYAYGASIEDAKWKHRYDIFYIKHHKLLLDIKIVFLTIKVVLFGMGR